jgi:sorting nexin-4
MSKISIRDHEVFMAGTYTSRTHNLTSFVEYKVEPVDGEPVKRRYKEFVWLSQALNNAAPGAIVPPLPPDTKGSGNLEPAFIRARRDGLESFLNQVLNHNEDLAEKQCFK